MTGILKVDTIQKNNGGTPTVRDLGLNISGMVLQTIGGSYQVTTNTYSATSSSSFVNSGLPSISITPQLSTSKIRVTVSVPAQLVPNGGSTYGAMALYRNGSNVLTGSSPAVMSFLQSPATGNNASTTMSFSWIDSPSTTSLTTYSLYILTTGSTFQVCPQVQNMGTGSGYTFMLEEIAQ